MRWTYFSIFALLSLMFSATAARAQKWVSPHFDTHRLAYRDLG